MIEPSLAELRRRVGVKWTKFGDDVVPAWVADMDFPPASVIVEEVQAFLAGGDWGYMNRDYYQRLIEAGRSWYQDHHGWAPSAPNSRVVLDVMQGVAAAIQAFTLPGEGVIITTPVYHPFGWAIESSNRVIVEAPLTGSQDGFRITKAALEEAVDRGGRLLLLCNPHNPTGRVFSAQELAIVAEVATAADLIVVSDEIHADLVYEPHRHIPVAALGPEISERTVLITSPSKAFNLAGVGCAMACFGTAELAEKFDALPTLLLGHPTATGLRASSAAWESGGPWLAELRTLLANNRDTVTAWVQDDRRVGFRPPEATYLAWLDFRPHNWSVEPHERLLAKARVALSEGTQFGTGGAGHARLNFGTYPSVLENILERVADALEPTKLVL